MNSRRSFLFKTLLATTGALSKPLVSLSKSVPLRDIPSLAGRKVLFTHGGWDGHEPEKFRDYLVGWMRAEGAEVLVYDNLESYTNEELMNNLDLILQIRTMSEITKEQEAGLLKAIKNGAGMAGWHGGMCDAFRNNPEYQYMTGGQWVSHPGGIIGYSVQITNTTDEITAELKDFQMTSEQYYMHVDPNVKVLATTRFTGDHNDWIDGSVMPVVWKKMYAKGRVFYTSLGHNLDHLTKIPEAITILKRGIRWASASRYAEPEKWLSPVYGS